MEKNLIEKLAGKWADFKYAVRHSKIARRVATLMLAGAMAVPVVLSASACTVTIKDNGDGTFDINPVDPNPGDGTGNNQGNNQGNQQGGNQQGGSTEKPEPDYSKYSQLLRDVLTDPEYDELYKRYESGDIKEGTTGDLGLNLFEAIPYDYLANKGEDVESIKNGKVAVSADLYTLNNDNSHLYNKLNITHFLNNGENYINQYLLKYKISEQELKDLTMLYNGKYYQGPVMFQKLSSTREPIQAIEFSLTEKANKNLISGANNKKTAISILTNYDQIGSVNIMSMTPTTLWGEDCFETTFLLFGSANNTDAVSKRNLYEITAQQSIATAKISFNNNILDLDNINAMYPNLISSTPITYFQLNHAFKNAKTTLNK